MAIHRLANVIGEKTVAVVLPCRNEGLSVAAVVLGFQKALPGAEIIVFDNDSDDNTGHMARAAGARVVREDRPGKGNLVRRIFADIDADLYIMADADGSCDPTDAPALIERLIETGSDMVVGVRTRREAESGRIEETIGASAMSRLYRLAFGPEFSDVTSGYRILTRRFAKSFPSATAGFGIETEMSVHAGELRIPVSEFPVTCVGSRNVPPGKAQTPRETVMALRSFLSLVSETRPLMSYAALSILPAVLSIGLTLTIVNEFVRTGLVTQLPAAALAAGFMLAALVLGCCGVVLDRIRRFGVEQKRLAYLSYPGFSTNDLPGAGQESGPDESTETGELPRVDASPTNRPVTRVA